MKLRDIPLDQFVTELKRSHVSLVVYGLGVIGKIVVPSFLEEYRLTDQVLFIADQDAHKQGEHIRVSGRDIIVCAPDKMKEFQDEFAILVTGSRYAAILESFNQFDWLADTDVFIFPKMLVEKSRSLEKQKIIRHSGKQQIPKLIHYCWFGGKEIPDKLRRYMDSWSKYCPDYRIVEWNESNYDLEKYAYTAQAYKYRRWGFIPDIVRLDVLHEYGGIYLDTDVELIRPLDDLLYQPGFCGIEKWGVVNIGGGCGVMPGHPMIQKILDYRLQFEFERADGTLNLESSGSFETTPLLEEGFKPDNTTQCVGGLTVYTSDFFHPFDYMSKELSVTDNTYGIHHFYGSWV